MATALPLATAFTDASTTEAQLKTALTSLRAALAEMGDPTGRHGAIQNLSLVFSVGSNALTCNVKTRAGATPSATDPVSAGLRAGTSANGDFNVRNITGALSLTISSGSTLGHANGLLGAIYWYLIDNAGTLELAASTSYFGPKGIVTTVAEGGAGAADSERVMYSTVARSNVAHICVGRSLDLQTTAGTWTAVPLSIGLSPVTEFATFNVFSRSSNTMLDILDWGKTIVATSTFTQTLDAVTTLGDGWWVRYRNNGSGVITLDPNASETIDGLATVRLFPGESCTIMCNGSNLVTVGRATTLIKRKTADESVASSTTLQDDDHLVFEIGANEEWVVDYDLDVGSNLLTTGVKFAVNSPAGSTVNNSIHLCASLGNEANTNSRVQRTTTIAGALSFPAANFPNGQDGVANIRFWILNGATAGSVTLQFAQDTSGGTPVNLRKGSRMMARRIVA